MYYKQTQKNHQRTGSNISLHCSCLSYYVTGWIRLHGQSWCSQSLSAKSSGKRLPKWNQRKVLNNSFVEPTRHHCVFGSIIVKYYITEVLCWQHIGKEALTVLFPLFHRSFVGGVRIAIDASIQASVLAEDQLQTVLEAAIYQAHEIPSDYLPRYDIWSLDVYKQLHSNTGNNLHIHHIPTENGI